MADTWAVDLEVERSVKLVASLGCSGTSEVTSVGTVDKVGDEGALDARFEVASNKLVDAISMAVTAPDVVAVNGSFMGISAKGGGGTETSPIPQGSFKAALVGVVEVIGVGIVDADVDNPAVGTVDGAVDCAVLQPLTGAS